MACPDNSCSKSQVTDLSYIQIWLTDTYLLRRTEMTSEQIREKRRLERKQFKQDRAAAQAQAAAEAEAAFHEGREASATIIPSGATWKPSNTSDSGPSYQQQTDEQDQSGREEERTDLEHLQLTLQEAFFLAWNLDCLVVLNPDTVIIHLHHNAY